MLYRGNLFYPAVYINNDLSFCCVIVSCFFQIQNNGVKLLKS